MFDQNLILIFINNQGTITEIGVRAAVVYSQSWRVGGVISPRNRHRPSGWSRLNVETIRQANGVARPEDFPFAGWYRALLTLPRYRFQYAVYDRNNNIERYALEAVRFPPGAPASDWSRVVLVRGTNRNYLSHLSAGNIMRFGSFSSFSDRFQEARNYAAPPSWQDDDGQPTIIMIQERVQRGNSPPPAYARPIRDLSLFPYQREYLIDPITRFRVISVEINEILGVTRHRGRGPNNYNNNKKIPLTIIRLEFLDM